MNRNLIVLALLAIFAAMPVQADTYTIASQNSRYVGTVTLTADCGSGGGMLEVVFQHGETTRRLVNVHVPDCSGATKFDVAVGGDTFVATLVPGPEYSAQVNPLTAQRALWRHGNIVGRLR